MKNKSAIKKILSTILVAVFSFSAVLTGVSATTTDIDLNADGCFDISDSTHLQMHLAGYFDFDNSLIASADADSSGSVDIGDVTYIQMILAGYNNNVDTTTKPTQPTTQPTTKPKDDLENYVDEVIRLTNVERKKIGVPSLSKRSDMCEIAEIRGNELVTSFSHTRPNGEGPFEIVKRKGIDFYKLGENIAFGQRTPDEVVTAWYNSESHRRSMLDEDFTGIGVACHKEGNTLYWVQYFIG